MKTNQKSCKHCQNYFDPENIEPHEEKCFQVMKKRQEDKRMQNFRKKAKGTDWNEKTYQSPFERQLVSGLMREFFKANPKISKKPPRPIQKRQNLAENAFKKKKEKNDVFELKIMKEELVSRLGDSTNRGLSFKGYPTRRKSNKKQTAPPTVLESSFESNSEISSFDKENIENKKAYSEFKINLMNDEVISMTQTNITQAKTNKKGTAPKVGQKSVKKSKFAKMNQKPQIAYSRAKSYKGQKENKPMSEFKIQLIEDELLSIDRTNLGESPHRKPKSRIMPEPSESEFKINFLEEEILTTTEAKSRAPPNKKFTHRTTTKTLSRVPQRNLPPQIPRSLPKRSKFPSKRTSLQEFPSDPPLEQKTVRRSHQAIQEDSVFKRAAENFVFENMGKVLLAEFKKHMTPCKHCSRKFNKRN